MDRGKWIAVSVILIGAVVGGADGLALTVTDAKIDKGAVQVRGKNAQPGAAITWEGQEVALADGQGKFKFTTAALPLDCVGLVSDAVDSAPAVIKSCGLVGLCLADTDLSAVKAVGIGPLNVRLSGIGLGGDNFVTDFEWTGTALSPGSSTPSLPPSIANLRAQVFPGDVATCGADFPDRVQLTFDYTDPNGDVLGGAVGVGYQAMFREPPGLGPLFGGFQLPFFPPSEFAVLTSPTATSGTASLPITCWVNIAHFDFSVRLKDAAENLSAETLTIPVDIPAAAAPAEGRAQRATGSGTGGGFRAPW